MNTSIKILLLIGTLSLSLSSCMEEECIRTDNYTVWDPLYMSRQDMQANIGLEDPRALNQPGKIYYYGDYLIINEINKGVHIIDNSSPKDPIQLGFLAIPGNVDIAIHNNLLYADNYMDLISIDISDIMNPMEVDRAEDIFIGHFYHVEDRGYIVGHEITNRTMEVDCNNYYYGWGCFMMDDFSISAESSLQNVGFSNAQNAPQGVGGSMARFTISQDFLYVLNSANLLPVEISNGLNLKEEVPVEWGIETVFPYENYLFVGADDGMHIFDASDPAYPTHMSTFEHANACDPVFVRDQKAYVTLRNGSECQNFINQLDVVDIADLNNPVLLNSFDMQNPHGLFVTEDEVYICEGDNGMKILDRKKLEQNVLQEIGALHNLTAFDIIILEGRNLAMVIGKDGLYQFDISTANDPQLLSEILVSN